MNSPEVESGMRMARAGRFAEALALLERAVLAGSDNPALLAALAGILQQAGLPGETQRLHRVVAGMLPDEAVVLTAWAGALLLAGERQPALDLLERALAATPGYAAPAGALGALLQRIADPDLKCDVLEALSRPRPSHAGLLRHLGAALLEAERLPEAKDALERLRELDSSNPYCHVELGRLAMTLGEPAQARTHFRAALEADAGYAAAFWELAQADGWRVEPALLQRIETLCRGERDPKALAGLHATLARCHDRDGDPAAAARHAGIAKTLMAALASSPRPYDPLAHRAEIDAALLHCTPALLQRLREAGDPDRRPVFIIGLPRSGTTLLERMLAAHPAIAGVGEQAFAVEAMRRALRASGGTLSSLVPAAVREAAGWHLRRLEDRLHRLGLDPSTSRIVDKMPDNYLLAGWLRIAFPHATIVHCLRDPRDVALSCWLTQFAGVSWSLSLGHIAQRIEQHRRLMRHWRATLGQGLVETRYEQLVSDPEAVLRRLLAAMALDWHPGVLDFAARGGFVASASRQQVREPLHDRSIGRWRHYEAMLEPVLPKLDAIAAADELEAGTALAAPVQPSPASTRDRVHGGC